MGFWEVFFIGIGLAMDAFAVSVGKGLATPKYEPKGSLICGLWFGGFQMLMPLIGCFLGTQFAGYIESVDHWIAFVLLALIGGNMIRESRSGEAEDVDSSYAPMRMLPLAVATSIDALAVGVTFAFLGTDIWRAVAVIGVTTFVLSAAGPMRMLPLAVATSIDALAVGVTFAFLGTDIWRAVAVIGVTTFVLSAAGVRIGSVFGEKYASRAELAGGVLLVLMGTRILLNHLDAL